MGSTSDKELKSSWTDTSLCVLLWKHDNILIGAVIGARISGLSWLQEIGRLGYMAGLLTPSVLFFPDYDTARQSGKQRPVQSLAFPFHQKETCRKGVSLAELGSARQWGR